MARDVRIRVTLEVPAAELRELANNVENAIRSGIRRGFTQLSQSTQGNLQANTSSTQQVADNNRISSSNKKVEESVKDVAEAYTEMGRRYQIVRGTAQAYERELASLTAQERRAIKSTGDLTKEQTRAAQQAARVRQEIRDLDRAYAVSEGQIEGYTTELNRLNRELDEYRATARSAQQVDTNFDEAATDARQYERALDKVISTQRRLGNIREVDIRLIEDQRRAQERYNQALSAVSRARLQGGDLGIPLQELRASRAELTELETGFNNFFGIDVNAGQTNLDRSLGAITRTATRLNSIFSILFLSAEGLQVAIAGLNRGTQVIEVQESFNLIGGTLEQQEELLNRIRIAGGGLLTTYDSLNLGNALLAGTTDELRVALNENADALVRIARAAIRANPELSQTYGGVSGVVARLTEGIRKLEPELLDEFRLIVRIGEATEAYAEETNKSTAALTENERRVAFLNATLAQGQNLINDLNGELDSNADAYDRLITNLTNTRDAFVETITEGLLPFVEFIGGTYQARLDQAADSTRGLINGIREDSNRLSENLTRLSQGFDSVFQTRADAQNQGRNALAEGLGFENDTADIFGDAAFQLFGVGGIIRSFREFTQGNIEDDAAEATAQIIRNIGDESETTGELVEILSNQFERLAQEQRDYIVEEAGEEIIRQLTRTSSSIQEVIDAYQELTDQEITLGEILSVDNELDAEVFGIIAERGLNVTGLDDPLVELIANQQLAARSFQENLEGVDEVIASTNEELAKLEETTQQAFDTTFVKEFADQIGETSEQLGTLLDEAAKAGATSEQLIELARSSGLVSDAQLDAAISAAQMQAEISRLATGVTLGTITNEEYASSLSSIARAARIAAFESIQFSTAQRQSILSAAIAASGGSGLGLGGSFASALNSAVGGGFGGFGGSGGIGQTAGSGGQEFLNLFKSIAEQGVDEFRKSIEESEESLSDLEIKFLDTAQAAGASVDELQAFAEAIGEGEVSAEAFRRLAADKAIESIADQFLNGELSAEQAAEAVNLLQQQLAAGEDIDLSSLGIQIREVNEAAIAAGGAPSQGVRQLGDWLRGLVGAAENIDFTANELLNLGRVAGFTDQEIQDALVGSSIERYTQSINENIQDIGFDEAAEKLGLFIGEVTNFATSEELANFIDGFNFDLGDPNEDLFRGFIEGANEAGASAQGILEAERAVDGLDGRLKEFTQTLQEGAVDSFSELLERAFAEGFVGGDEAIELLREYNGLISEIDDADTLALILDVQSDGASINEVFSLAQLASEGINIGVNIQAATSLARAAGINAARGIATQQDIESGAFTDNTGAPIDELQYDIVANTDGLEEAIDIFSGEEVPIELTANTDEVREQITSVTDIIYPLLLEVNADSIRRQIERAVQGATITPAGLPPAAPTNGLLGPFAEGGLVVGKSHSQGSEFAVVEGGEFILRKSAVTPDLISSLNLINSGRVPGSVLRNAISDYQTQQLIPLPGVASNISSTVSNTVNRNTNIVNNFGNGNAPARPGVVALNSLV